MSRLCIFDAREGPLGVDSSYGVKTEEETHSGAQPYTKLYHFHATAMYLGEAGK